MAVAQDVQRIAAVVNDDVVSLLDLKARMRLVLATSGMPDTPEMQERMAPQVMRSLIDERLQLQEAERVGIAVPEEAIDQGLEELASKNNMTYPQLEQLFKRMNVPMATLRQRVHAQMVWSGVVQQRLGERMNISDAAIDEELALLRSQLNLPQNRVAEIYLSVDNPADEAEIRTNAERLYEQLKRGANFQAVARQFSQASTAAAGGDVGWIPQGHLDPEVEAVLADMKPGQVAPPIRITGGYLIVLLIDRRQGGGRRGTEEVYALFQQAVPFSVAGGRGKAEALARRLGDEAADCAALGEMAAEAGLPPGRESPMIRLQDLPPPLAEKVKPLGTGQDTGPLPTNGAFLLVMVCQRATTEAGLPTREEVANSLRQERVERASQRLLRDLRRNAFVDIRV